MTNDYQNNNYQENNGFNSDTNRTEGSNQSDFWNENDYAYKTIMRNGMPKTKGWSVASLVIGIFSAVCCCFGWSGLVLGALAVVFAVLSRRRLGYFDGMSIAGLVLGIFGFVIGAILTILTYALPQEFWDEFYKGYLEGLEQSGAFEGV